MRTMARSRLWTPVLVLLLLLASFSGSGCGNGNDEWGFGGFGEAAKGDGIALPAGFSPVQAVVGGNTTPLPWTNRQGALQFKVDTGMELQVQLHFDDPRIDRCAASTRPTSCRRRACGVLMVSEKFPYSHLHQGKTAAQSDCESGVPAYYPPSVDIIEKYLYCERINIGHIDNDDVEAFNDCFGLLCDALYPDDEDVARTCDVHVVREILQGKFRQSQQLAPTIQIRLYQDTGQGGINDRWALIHSDEQTYYGAVMQQWQLLPGPGTYAIHLVEKQNPSRSGFVQSASAYVDLTSTSATSASPRVVELTVTSTSNQPAANIQVALGPIKDVTDEKGIVRLQNVYPGRYVVKIGPDGYERPSQIIPPGTSPGTLLPSEMYVPPGAGTAYAGLVIAEELVEAWKQKNEISCGDLSGAEKIKCLWKTYF